MRFLRHWAKASARATSADGRRLEFACWRGSDLSVEDARTRARMAAEEVAARAAQTGEPPRAYLYGDRPLREEVVRPLDGNGSGGAVVTRNAYGCLVLNTAGALFVDVDLSGTARGAERGGGWLARWLGRGRPASPHDEPQASALAT